MSTRAEGRRVGQVEAQEQAHFFEAAVTKALGFVQDDERHDFAQFRHGGFDEGQVGFAAEGRPLAQFGGQGREQAAAAQAGMSQEQRAKQATVQTLEPVAHQGGLAHAVGTGQEQDAAQRGRLVQQGEGALVLRGLQPGLGGEFAKGHGGGAPLASQEGEVQIRRVFHKRRLPGFGC